LEINWDLWAGGRCVLHGVALPRSTKPDEPLATSQLPTIGLCSLIGPQFKGAFANTPNGFTAEFFAEANKHSITSVQELQAALNCTREWYVMGRPAEGKVEYTSVVIGGVFEQSTPGVTIGGDSSRKRGPAGGGAWCVTESEIISPEKLATLMDLADELKKAEADMVKIRDLLSKLGNLATKFDINAGVLPLRRVVSEILNHFGEHGQAINSLIATRSRIGLSLVGGGHPGQSALGFVGIGLTGLVPFGESTRWALDISAAALVGIGQGKVGGGALVNLMVTYRLNRGRFAVGGLGSWVQNPGFTASLVVGGGLKGCANFGKWGEGCLAGGPGLDLVPRAGRYVPTFGGQLHGGITVFLDRPIKPVRAFPAEALRQQIAKDPFPQIGGQRAGADEASDGGNEG
jgi:hypothetical protein